MPTPPSCSAIARFKHDGSPVKPGQEVQPGVDLLIYVSLFLPPEESIPATQTPTWINLVNLNTRILVSPDHPPIAWQTPVFFDPITVTPGVADEQAGKITVRVRHGGAELADELSWSEWSTPVRSLVGDANADGTVDVDDLIAVQQAWGASLSEGESS